MAVSQATANYVKGSGVVSGSTVSLSTGTGSVSQGTLEGISYGKLSGPLTSSEAGYGFLDSLAYAGYKGFSNATEGSVAYTNFKMESGDTIYFSVTGGNKDYYGDFAYATVKYTGNGAYNVPSFLESYTFDSTALKVDMDSDWGTTEYVKFTAPKEGFYQFSIGVADGFDTVVDSQITIGGFGGAGISPSSGTVNQLELNNLKFLPNSYFNSGFSIPTSTQLNTVSVSWTDISSTIGSTSNSLTTGGQSGWSSNSGNYYLSTNQWNKGGISYGSDGVTISTANANAKDFELEQFFGLTSGTLDKTAAQTNSTWGSTTAFYSNATAGSGYKQAVKVSGVGDTVSFDYKWDGGDYLPYNDFAFVTVGSKIVQNESTAGTTLFSSAGSTSGGALSYSGNSISSSTVTNNALVSVQGAGNYNDVVGKFEYKIKDTDTLYTIGSDKYVILGIGVTDVNDEVVDSSITINNFGSTAAVASGSGFSGTSYSAAAAGVIASKQTAIAQTLSQIQAPSTSSSGGSVKAAANNDVTIANTLAGFDYNLIAGSNSVFSSSSSVASSFSSSFDWASLLNVLTGKSSASAEFKLDFKVSIDASFSSSIAGLASSSISSSSSYSLSTAIAIDSSGNTSSSTSTSSVDWSKVDFNGATTETKKTVDWSKVKVGSGAGAVTTEKLSTTDLLQASVAGATTYDYKSTDWSKVNTAEFSSETYNSLDYSKVQFGDLTTESKKTMDWSKVKIGSGSNSTSIEKLSTTDLVQSSLAGATTVNYKTTDWSKVNFAEFSEESYSSLDWSKVSVGNVTSEQKSTIEWNKVNVGSLSKEWKKEVDWSKVDIGGASTETYSETDKLQVAIAGGATSESLSTVKWKEVKAGEFSSKTYDSMDWSKVKIGDMTSESLSELNWSKVKFGDVSTDTYNSMDWSKVQFGGENGVSEEKQSTVKWDKVKVKDITSESKKTLNWSVVKAGGAKTENLSTTDSFQITAADGKISTSTMKTTDWSKINIGEFSSETYKNSDWSLVNFGDVTTEAKKTTSWSKIADGLTGTTNETLDTTDDFQLSINSTGDKTKLSKKTNWKKLQVGEFSEETYSAIDWKQVNMGSFQKVEQSTIDWSNVQFGEFSSKQNKQTNWSKVNYDQFEQEDYNEVNWGEVNWAGGKSVNYDAVKWQNVFSTENGQEFSSKNSSKINWNKVQIGDLTEENYASVDWGYVNFKGMTTETYSTLDWGKVDIGDFSSSTYKKTDWSKVQFGEFTDEQYLELDWSKVNCAQLGKSEESMSSIAWGKVDFGGDATTGEGGWSKKNYKQTDWSKVQIGEFSSEQYSEVDWALVKFKGSKGFTAEQYKSLDWNQVIADDSFTSKAAKSVDWSKVQSGAVNSESMSKLEGFGLKGKAGQGIAALKASESLLFTGISASSGASGPASATPYQADPVLAALSAAEADKKLQLV